MASKAGKAVKEVATKSKKLRLPPTHGVNIITHANNMRQYGHIQGTSVLRGYHPLQDELLNLYKGDKTYIYGVSKVTLQWCSKGSGNSGARHFKYDKLPPLVFWNPDVKFNIRKKIEGLPSLTLELANGKVEELDIANKKADEIEKILLNAVNSVTTKDPAAAEAFVEHWGSRQQELLTAEKENIVSE